MWKRIAESHRNRIRRGLRYGFTARFVPLGDVLDAFVDIYEQTMVRVGAKESYYFGRDYFTALAELPGVHCGIVESGIKIISACVFLESHGIVQAHLGGTATEHFAQSPFHLCWNQAMLWGKQRGNHWLHLGGGLGGINDQLLQFKARFSPQRFRFHTSRIVLNEPQYLQLVDRAALSTQCSPQQLLESKFFPAYRAEPPLR